MRDLLIKMSLDTTDYKTKIDSAKQELRLLKSEYSAVSSDSSLEQSAATLLQNLQEQKAAVEREIQAYKEGIENIKAKLNEVAPDSQNEKSLLGQATQLETKMNNAEAALNNLETKLQTARMDNLLDQAQQLSTLFMTLKLGLGDALDFFGDAADSADDAFVRRETAFIQATKNVEDARQTKDDLDALNQGLTEMATRIPQTYEELAGLLGVGATLGVPYENLLAFTEVMAKLNVATNVAGESGAQAMAQFLNITEKGYDNLDRVGAALTELGNNSATTEQNILEMAHRASTGLSTVGMSTADILALSAALNSVGIEAQAGGSSVSKLGITMDKAANVGAQEITKLLDAWNQGMPGPDTVYELYALLDSLSPSDGWKGFASNLGMTMSDTKALMNSALAAERFSKAMGQTVDEFSQSWNEDAASQMLNFFRALGSMDGSSEEENMLWVMDQLGIKEIRQSNMVRALANNWELYANMLALGRNAYEENIALENEAERAFGTYESQRAINANKAENAAQQMGETVAAIRQPWDDFFGDLQQWFAEWPDWAQDAVGRASEVLGRAGDVLEWMGSASFAAVNITNALKMLQQMGAGAKLGSAAATAGKVLGGLAIGGAVGYGLYELGVFINDLADHTNEIADKLASLEITIDPVSKEATLAAIREVKEAAEGLGGGDMEKYAAASRTVQMGFGTSGMFGQALAYEQYQAEKALEEIYTRYGGVISRYEQNLMANEGDALAQANWQKNIESATADMEREAAAARAAYGETMNRVLNGAIQQAGGTELLEGISEQYRALDLLYSAYNEYVDNGRKANYRPENWEALTAAMKGAGFNMAAMLYGSRGNVQEGQYKQMAEFIWGQLAEQVGAASQNGALMNILASALTSGALENADQSAFSGAFLGLLEAMDVKAISETGVKNWQDIGKNSMIGLGQGITENQSEATDAAKKAAQDVTAAAAATLGVQSPSTVFEAIGENIDLGLANGIYARADEAIAAASWLAAQVESAMRTALDINSPSGVAKRMGVFLGEGLAQGIEGSLGRVERAAGSLANGVSAAGNRNIDVTLNLDGKTLTRMIAPLMDEALGEQVWQQ